MPGQREWTLINRGQPPRLTLLRVQRSFAVRLQEVLYRPKKTLGPDAKDPKIVLVNPFVTRFPARLTRILSVHPYTPV